MAPMVRVSLEWRGKNKGDGVKEDKPYSGRNLLAGQFSIKEAVCSPAPRGRWGKKGNFKEVNSPLPGEEEKDPGC